jgi:hypothetical protein
MVSTIVDFTESRLWFESLNGFVLIIQDLLCRQFGIESTL